MLIFGFRAWAVSNLLSAPVLWPTYSPYPPVRVVCPDPALGACGGRCRVGSKRPEALLARETSFDTCCMQRAEQSVGHFNYCWFCGTQTFAEAPVSRDPDTTAVRIDVEQLEACRAVVFAAMAGRPGQRRKSKVTDDFDAFLLARLWGCRGWATTTDDDVFDWACFLDSQGHGATWVHDRSCPGVGLADGGACRPGSGCTKRYAAGSMDKRFISKLRMAMQKQLGKVEEWDPGDKKGNPCSSASVESYLTFVREEQKQVGVPVKQAAPILSHTLAQLLQSMRVRSQLAESLSQRIAITRGNALFSLAFYHEARIPPLLHVAVAGPAIARVGRFGF